LGGEVKRCWMCLAAPRSSPVPLDPPAVEVPGTGVEKGKEMRESYEGGLSGNGGGFVSAVTIVIEMS
jgi:hypothetical protein